MFRKFLVESQKLLNRKATQQRDVAHHIPPTQALARDENIFLDVITQRQADHTNKESSKYPLAVFSNRSRYPSAEL